MTESFETLIVGAGPTGLACGIELQRRGIKTVLVEKGCVVNSIYHYPTNMVFFTTPELLEIGNIPMTSLNEKPNRHEALKYYRRVAEHYRLDIRQYERVEQIAGTDNSFEIHAPTISAPATSTWRAKSCSPWGTMTYQTCWKCRENNWKRSCIITRSRIRTTTTTWRSLAARIRRPLPPWNCIGPARESR